MWITKEESKKFLEKIRYKPMAKKVAEDEKIPITGYMKSDAIWYLVNEIIHEKWSFVNESFKDGDLSETLLKEIGKVLREKAEDEFEKKDNLAKKLLEWEPFGPRGILIRRGNYGKN